ncbi:phosphoenolpyruvate carboxykinase (ATP) 2-like [Actinidia eriantha]|uniref:phosphoenolpyruvate carboxykinase (ATP) 2-like n=1 Tax=Actinidia eriantha TaxID=165200 RepID=UPI002583A4EB|nr:phosphoenolpyruvate carboxykinase (ATP) 2-like [Actinidia eriantha]
MLSTSTSTSNYQFWPEEYVLEKVVFDEHTREVDYTDKPVTENTRVAYPIEYIPNAKIPCVGPHPKNVILLACDAFCVLPHVSKLSLAQTMYHFISGYTALVAGTEDGIKEPQATFSACFGAAFIMLHPTKYAAMLAAKCRNMVQLDGSSTLAGQIWFWKSYQVSIYLENHRCHTFRQPSEDSQLNV